MNKYEMLQQLHDEIDALINDQVIPIDDSFIKWKKRADRLIGKNYGSNSIEFKQFNEIQYDAKIFNKYDTRTSFVTQCRVGLEKAKELLAEFLEEWEDDSMQNKYFNNKQAFIVHGHDEQLKIQVARLLEQQNIDAIILHEQPNAGKTIIEKIEHYSDVGAAVILFTPDDSGKANNQTDYMPRARQNVVFEAGYFMGYLGRDKIIPVVTDSSIELPSDLQGVVYTSSDMWQFKIVQELKAIGFDVDMNKVKL